jgi:hypothetical protein
MLQNIWHLVVRPLSGEATQFANPSNLSTKAYMRKWHRRQAEALREARERQEQGSER